MTEQMTLGFVPDFKVGDHLLMTTPDGRKHQSIAREVVVVDGVQHVRFCIDWDEGPATYLWRSSELEKL